MKKILAIGALFAFFLYANSSIATVTLNHNSVELEKGKCDKCGSKKCDGKCEAKTEEKKASTSETKSGSCCSQSKKSCESKKEK